MITRTRPKPLPRVAAPPFDALRPGLWIGVTIDRTPPREVSPNGRSHFHARAKLTKPLFEAAKLATHNVIVGARLGRVETPFPDDAWLELSIRVAWPKGHQRMDDDNAIASCKHLRDGFAAALGINDARMRLVRFEQVRDADGLGWVRIEGEPERRD